MRRGRVFILLALILLGIAVVAFLFTRGTGITGGPAEPEPTPLVMEATIVIAAQDIPRGAVIPADGVILSPYPADMVVETMATDIAEVVGKRARMDIARGVPITTNMVTEEAGDLLGTGSDASLAIKPGFSAISIPITRLSGVAFALRPGDSVDVLVSMLVADLDAEFQSLLPNISAVLVDPDGETLTSLVCDAFTEEAGCVFTEPRPFGRSEVDPATGELVFLRQGETQRPRLVTQRLVERATVLHVGTFPLEAVREVVITEEGETQEMEQVSSVVVTPDIVTLIVSPQDALALNYAVKAGIDIVLTLRGPDDLTQFETSSVSLQYLFDNYNIAVPSKLPYGLQPRLDSIITPVLPNEGVPPPAE
ncbi:MAG: hypothetical protein GTO18_18575 [Anaerolineales bacterium]|nr:hypothetical protein [Anaerolineales bacterium]